MYKTGHKGPLCNNMSLQTDMMDLLGSDLPVPCDNGMQFAWSDGILLQVGFLPIIFLFEFSMNFFCYLFRLSRMVVGCCWMN